MPTDKFIKDAIEVITKKIILDILMGFSKNIDDQIGILGSLREDIIAESEAEIEKNT